MAQSKSDIKNIKDAQTVRTFDEAIKAKGQRAELTGEPLRYGYNHHRVFGGFTLPDRLPSP